MSRASVTDSTLYEVNAKFNLELATVNTKESQKQTLNFDVKYLAVVENVTELTPVLEYDLEQTEYNLKGGEEKVVTLEQVSKFANGDEAVYSGQPQASVSLKAEKAMVFVSSVDELKALIDTEDANTSQEGTNPITHTYQKKFAAGCSRDTIKEGAERLGWTLEELMEKTIFAMRSCEAAVNAQMEQM